MCHKLCNASEIYYYADTTVLAFGWVSRQENMQYVIGKKGSCQILAKTVAHATHIWLSVVDPYTRW